MEIAGAGAKHNGCFYVCGHSGNGRQLVSHFSYDLENWTQASRMGMRRTNIPPPPTTAGDAIGEPIDMGAGLWNRGNVLLDFYGMWNGHPSNDRRPVNMTWDY